MMHGWKAWEACTACELQLTLTFGLASAANPLKKKKSIESDVQRYL